jgi:hypothetical protein
MWLAVHTGYCKRHRSRLTVTECEKQQQYSQTKAGDFRCAGCSGLNHQPEVIDEFGEYGISRPQLKLVRPLEIVESTFSPDNAEDEKEELSARIAEVSESEQDTDCQNVLQDGAGIRDLTVLTGLLGEDDELAKELKSLFEELDELDAVEIELPELLEPVHQTPVKPRRYAVYKGKCKRCGGYMDNTREYLSNESWDEDVYRCLACGWRTSPAYAWNRENTELAGWNG